ncbi:DUF4845 domain-containing protein [Acidovorax sp.]|uniref:DUF4845 domain-containing protein n=1 Tax=Acidovorax sp. TaxID=1872122 RepID=UPI00391F7792
MRKLGQSALRSRQRGMSFFGVVILGVLVVAVVAIGGQSVPIFLEYSAAKQAIEKVKSKGSALEIRGAFDRAAIVDSINSIQGKDLEITKRGDKMVVGFKYSREIALAGPAYLVYRFEAQTN